MKKLLAFNVVLAVVTLSLARDLRAKMKVEVSEGTIQGQIFEVANKRGIPGLTIKLTPPTASQAEIPEKVTSTDESGQFHFTGVQKGRYLLQVYYGLTPLYRDVLDTSKPTKIEVFLKRKGT